MNPKTIISQDSFINGLGSKNESGFFWWSQGIDIESRYPFLSIADSLLEEVNSATQSHLKICNWSAKYNTYDYVLTTDGKFLKYIGGVWTYVHQDSVGSVGNGMYGDSLIESGTETGKLYYCSNTKVGIYDAGTDVWIDTWQTLAVSNNGELSPMTKFLKFICIGNQRYLATYDTASTTWNNTRLTLPVGYKIKWVKGLSNYLMISAHHSTEGSAIFLWDGVSTTYNDAIRGLPECLAGEVYNNTLYIITADGWISEFNGSGFTPLNQFPDMQQNIGNITLHPDAFKAMNGYIYIGKIAHGVNLDKRYYAGGIWLFNINTKALYFKHMLSGKSIVNTGITSIGTIILDDVNNIFRVSWRGTKYYIDNSAISGTRKPYKYGSIIVLPMMDFSPYQYKFFRSTIINLMKPLIDSPEAKIILRANASQEYFKTSRYASRGSTNYFELDSGWTLLEVGDLVQVLSGTGSGQFRNIIRIEDIGSGKRKIYVDSALDGSESYSNNSYLQISEFRKVGEIVGTGENIGKLDKVFQDNIRAKKMQLMIELRSPDTSYNVGIANVSTYYILDKIIR